MPTDTKVVDIKGGLNLVTPPMKRRGGGLQAVQNYRNDQDGGITRIGGYERFDGQAGPSEAIYYCIPFDNGSVEPEVGQDIIGGTSNTTAVVLSIVVTSGDWSTCDAAGNIYAVSVNGTFQNNELINAASGGGFSDGFSAGFEQGIASNTCPNFLAVATFSTPYVYIYDQMTFTKLTNPSTLPDGRGEDVAFNPDNTKLAVGHAGTRRLTVYNTSDWSKYSDPAVLPSGEVLALAFNAAGTLLAMLIRSQGIEIYDSSDADPVNWTKIIGPSESLDGAPTLPRDIAFGKSDTVLACTSSTSPYFYAFDTTTWNPITLGASIPATSFSLSFNDTDGQLAVGHTDSPYLTVFDTSTWATITVSSSFITNDVSAVSYNRANTELCVGVRGKTPDSWAHLDVSDWSTIDTGGPFTETPMAAAFSLNDNYHALIIAPSDLIRLYSGSDSGHDTQLTITGDPTSSPLGLTFSN